MDNNPGGQAPFGFRWNTGELVQEPTEAQTYALIFDLFLVHQRKGTVAKLLNERGLRTRASKEFSFATIKRLLENPIAKGIHRSSTTTIKDGKQINTVVEKSVAPIVSKNVWNHVQAILAEQSGSQSRAPTQNLFVGMIKCHCGTLMELPSKSSDYRCFKCEQKISTDDVLAIVEDQFSRLPLPSPKILKEKAKTAIVDLKNDPAQLLKTVERDIDKLFSLHSKNVITDEAFKERHDILDKRKRQLQAAQKTPQAQESPSSFIEYWQSLPKNLQRIVVENLVDNITVSPNQATVSLYSLFNFAQQGSTTPP